MASLALGVRYVPVSTGTADFAYSSTVTGYRSPVAGLTNSKVYRYRAESADLSQWEYGSGVWSSAINTLGRNTVSFSSTGSKVSFTAAPQVSISLDVPDVLQFDDAMTLTQVQQAQGRTNLAVYVQGYLFGLTLSTVGSSTTFTAAAGQAADSTGVDVLVLGSSLAKTTSAWAVGAAAGSLDTGAIAASTWYHVYLIKRTDTGVVDVLTSLSASAPTLPTNYSLFRRIGAMKTNGSSQWTAFTQIGDRFYWTTGVVDVNTTVTTSRSLGTLSCPPNTFAMFRAYFFNVTPGISVVFQPTAETDAAPSNSAAPLQSLFTEASNEGASGQFDLPVDASSQIAMRSSGSGSTVRILTFGWSDTRGRLS